MDTAINKGISFKICTYIDCESILLPVKKKFRIGP